MTIILHAKQRAEHRAAAVDHLNEAAEHIREAAKLYDCGDLEKAAHHVILAHAHGKHAKTHHGKAMKTFAEHHA